MPESSKEAVAKRLKIRTKELTDKLQTGMKELYDSEKYKDFLKTMAHFHQYSPKNIMLIHQQMPNATRVASFRLWKQKFNRHVKKGEKGLYIYAPVAGKKPEKKLMEKLDPETGAPLLDASGKVIMEEAAGLASAPRFKLVPIFDQSQTYGDPLPELVEDVAGKVSHYESFLDTLKAISPLPIVFEAMPDGKDGYCRHGDRIGIRDNMSEVQTIGAIVHEITHGRLHIRDGSSANAEPKTKALKETESESIAYVVCQHYGIETSPNSFGYLAEHGSPDMSELAASLDTIRKESGKLITAIDGRFGIICKERGIDLTKQPKPSKEPEQEETPSPEPDYELNSRTEKIAGMEFEFKEVVPKMANQGQESPPATAECAFHDGILLPDSNVRTFERDEFGYVQPDMLPLTQERALDLFEKGLTVYLLFPDNTEAMAFAASEIAGHEGILGIETEEWTGSKEHAQMASTQGEPRLESKPMHGKNQAVYKLSAETAMQDGEMDAFLQSREWNASCGQAIEKAISDSNYETYRYDLKTAVTSVTEAYGADRVAWVLAGAINCHSWDARLSSSNKDWAKGFDASLPDVCLNTHLTILDGFVNRFREAQREKPSLIDTLNANERKSKSQGKTHEAGIAAEKKAKPVKEESI